MEKEYIKKNNVKLITAGVFILLLVGAIIFLITDEKQDNTEVKSFTQEMFTYKCTCEDCNTDIYISSPYNNLKTNEIEKGRTCVLQKFGDENK